MSDQKPLVLLVDSNALIHRAYHALPPNMATSKGERTNAIYGFVSALISALETIRPTHVVCCFDVKGGTFRNAEYEHYKAQRKAMDTELLEQIPRIYEVVEAFGIPIVTKEGFEADDLIGTLARRFEKDASVIILTGDKDSLQLITDATSVMTFKLGLKEAVVYTPQHMQEQYGMTAHEFITYKALRGDPSDNIPGISGVGDKTAQKLVQQYHSLDQLYKALEEDPGKHPDLKGRLRENLIKEKDMAYLSYKLSTIDTNVDFDLKLEAAKRSDLDYTKIEKLFAELEFRSFTPRLAKLSTNPAAVQAAMTVVTAEHTLHSLEQFLQKTPHLHQMTVVPLLASKSLFEPGIAAIGVTFDGERVFALNWSNDVARVLKDLLESTTITKWLLDTKLLMHALNPYKIELKSPYNDVRILMQLVQTKAPDEPKVVAGAVLDDQLQALADLCAQVFTLGAEAMKEVQKEKLTSVWTRIEMPLIPVLSRMERAGIVLDTHALEHAAKAMEKELKELEAAIWKHAGQEFNIASPQQLATILFEKLGLGTDGVKKKKTGLSTDNETLENLKEAHPIIELVMRFREISKLKGTYVDSLPKLVDSRSSRLHTTYGQIGAATGRLSSNDPNLQNIPIRTELGNVIRKAFIAPKGKQLLSIDYSQFELRILAHLSGDKAMQESFKKGLDIHTATAAKIHGVELDQVTKEMRRAAKTINFGLMYGLSAHSVSKQLSIDYPTAKTFMERYFASYPSVKQFLADVVAQSQKDGYYLTLFGRRRLFPELVSSVWSIRQAGERMAMNFPMQGTQADILKMAMAAVDHALIDKQDISLLLTVHDELVFEVAEKQVEKYAKQLATIMTSVCKLDVPIVVSAKYGSNWAEMHEIDL